MSRWTWNRHTLYVRGLQLFWVAIALWFELGTFYHVLSSCEWPTPQPPMEGDERTSHILLIADPQVLDSHSYPGRSPWLVSLTQFIVDLNLRKSWRLVALKLNPHVVVFLGDMMDGGRGAISDNEYETYYTRFKSIFKLPYSPLPVYYIPGNHDTGLGTSSTFSPHASTRYTSHFGPLNNHISIANHTLLFIDAPGLVDEDKQRQQHRYNYDQWTAIPGGPVDYVKRLVADKRVISKPTVLFSHIPLSRPIGTSCGPLREKGTIHRGAGLGYQNTLSDEASHFLLQNVRPSIVFSGDDHDYCSVTHSLPPLKGDPSHKHASVEEISVKSLSMAMGIKRTGFQLLSLVSPSPNQAQLHIPCQLPDQLAIYLWAYIPLLVLTLLGLVVLNVHRIRTLRAKMSRSKTLAARTEIYEEDEATIGLTSVPFGKERMETEDEMHGCKVSVPGPIPGSGCASEDDWGGNTNNSYGFFHKKVYENGNEDATAGSAHSLPAPVSPRSNTASGSSSTNHIRREQQSSQRAVFSWTFVLGNQRRRVVIPPISEIPRLLVECTKGRRGRRRREVRDEERREARVGFVRGLGNDVVSVAWPPLGLFAVIAWWMFR